MESEGVEVYLISLGDTEFNNIDEVSSNQYSTVNTIKIIFREVS